MSKISLNQGLSHGRAGAADGQVGQQGAGQ